MAEQYFNIRITFYDTEQDILENNFFSVLTEIIK